MMRFEGKKKVRVRKPLLMSVLLQGKGKSKQRVTRKSKGTGTGLKYYGILINKVSMTLKRITEERIRKKIRKKASHVISIVM